MAFVYGCPTPWVTKYVQEEELTPSMIISLLAFPSELAATPPALEQLDSLTFLGTDALILHHVPALAPVATDLPALIVWLAWRRDAALDGLLLCHHRCWDSCRGLHHPRALRLLLLVFVQRRLAMARWRSCVGRHGCCSGGHRVALLAGAGNHPDKLLLLLSLLLASIHALQWCPLPLFLSQVDEGRQKIRGGSENETYRCFWLSIGNDNLERAFRLQTLKRDVRSRKEAQQRARAQRWSTLLRRMVILEDATLAAFEGVVMAVAALVAGTGGGVFCDVNCGRVIRTLTCFLAPPPLVLPPFTGEEEEDGGASLCRLGTGFTVSSVRLASRLARFFAGFVCCFVSFFGRLVSVTTLLLLAFTLLASGSVRLTAAAANDGENDDNLVVVVVVVVVVG